MSERMRHARSYSCQGPGPAARSQMPPALEHEHRASPSRSVCASLRRISARCTARPPRTATPFAQGRSFDPCTASDRRRNRRTTGPRGCARAPASRRGSYAKSGTSRTTRGRCDKLGPASDGNSGICSSLFSLLRELGGLCPVATGGFVRFPNECECIALVRHQNRQRHPRKQFTRDAANEFLPKLGMPKGPGDDHIGANSVCFALHDLGNRLAADVFQK